MTVKLRKMKTWSKLAAKKRRPSEYEIVTTNLQTRHRHPEQAYELSPASDFVFNKWYKDHVFESPLQHDDWEEFRDPDELIYRVYTRTQDAQEEYIDGLLDEYNEIEHDASISPEWLAVLERLYTPCRYLQTTLQMNAAYLVQITPASTLTACSVFQEGDEFRWLSRIAYRTRELQNAHPSLGFGKKEREYWEKDPAWQGVRELMEKVLATYDWGENFVSSNLIAKPVIDEILRQLGATARHSGDPLVSMLVDNQLRDSERSRRWSTAVVEFSKEYGENKTVIAEWIEKWMPLAANAISTYCDALPDSPHAAKTALANVEAFHRSLGVVD